VEAMTAEAMHSIQPYDLLQGDPMKKRAIT
jgi:hypothetical protein